MIAQKRNDAVMSVEFPGVVLRHMTCPKFISILPEASHLTRLWPCTVNRHLVLCPRNLTVVLLRSVRFWQSRSIPDSRNLPTHASLTAPQTWKQFLALSGLAQLGFIHLLLFQVNLALKPLLQFFDNLFRVEAMHIAPTSPLS